MVDSASTPYREFLADKTRKPKPAGFEPGELPSALFPFQRKIVEWAVRRGRAAIFAGCGLGKTLMQLAWADQVVRSTACPVLVLCPLAVGPQTVAEALRFGIPDTVQIENGKDIKGPGIYVTNYQKLLAGRFTPGELCNFAGVVLDESSILKNYTGKTKQLLCETFAVTPYKLACTATPAPNDHMELGNHAEFLGVMPSSEMLARWFIADQGDGAGKYRLKGHGEKDFWTWVASWAVCVDRPSDIGFSDEGFDLPALNWQQHIVAVDGTKGALPGEFWRGGKLTATSLHQEARLTAETRAAKVAELINTRRDEEWVVWCNTDYEADALADALSTLDGVVEVRGSMPDGKKEKLLGDFAEGMAKVIITKPTVAGFGLNWQHCCNVAFVGLSYSHEQLYQAVRRVWRFGQKQPVNAHLVIAETEGAVLSAVKRKERDNETLRAEMIAATRAAIGAESTEIRMIGHKLESGRGWTMHLGDCVDALSTLPADSIHFSIFSPPFSGLYIYSDAAQDMGNAADDDEFFTHFGYAVPEVLRVTIPGRLCAVHCKDLPRYAGRDGIAGLKDFPGWLVRLFDEHGWSYHSRVTIWKCPVTERERTNNNGLLHKTVVRDSSQIRQGMADYLIVFRKLPRIEDGLMSLVPVNRPFDRWVGDPGDDPRAEQKSAHPSNYARKKTPGKESIALWQRYAEPVWWDIDQTDTLNEKIARDDRDEKHICPLQLGLIRRAVYLWSLPGETILSPFAGLGSEGVVSLQEQRQFVGIELKQQYFDRACANLANATRQPMLPGMTDEGA